MNNSTSSSLDHTSGVIHIGSIRAKYCASIPTQEWRIGEDVFIRQYTILDPEAPEYLHQFYELVLRNFKCREISTGNYSTVHAFDEIFYCKRFSSMSEMSKYISRNLKEHVWSQHE